MRQLHLETLADDGSHLVLRGPSPDAADGVEGGTAGGADTGAEDRFTLAVDDDLRAALATVGAAPAHAAAVRPMPGRPMPGSAPDTDERPGAVGGASKAPAAVSETGTAPIGPREIQVRVRSGESPEALAASSGMSLDRVMRFAGAVLEERRRIAGEAARARARRSNADAQVVVFGEAVSDRFAAYGLDAGAVTWDAWRREDGEWLVVASWHTAPDTGTDWAQDVEREHRAEWIFHRTSRTVTPVDDAASDLLSDRPIRPAVPAPARPTLAVAPPLAPGVVAFPPMPDAHTGPLPRLDEVFDQDAQLDGPRSVPPLAPAAALGAAAALGSAVPPPAAPATPAPAAAVSTPAARSASARHGDLPVDEPTFDFEEPPLPLGIAEPATRPGAVVDAIRFGSRRDSDRGGRTKVPSWDDILLGVRRPTE